MNKTSQMLITVGIILAGAMLASALMLQFSSNDSWLAFVGWVIFFVAIQSPMIMVTQSSGGSCTAWLSRMRNKE